MPVYTFKCPVCNTIIEKMQKYTDDPPICDCDKKTHMNKIISKSNMVFKFKGSGFYITDYKNK